MWGEGSLKKEAQGEIDRAALPRLCVRVLGSHRRPAESWGPSSRCSSQAQGLTDSHPDREAPPPLCRPPSTLHLLAANSQYQALPGATSVRTRKREEGATWPRG